MPFFGCSSKLTRSLQVVCSVPKQLFRKYASAVPFQFWETLFRFRIPTRCWLALGTMCCPRWTTYASCVTNWSKSSSRTMNKAHESFQYTFILFIFISTWAICRQFAVAHCPLYAVYAPSYISAPKLNELAFKNSSPMYWIELTDSQSLSKLGLERPPIAPFGEFILLLSSRNNARGQTSVVNRDQDSAEYFSD